MSERGILSVVDSGHEAKNSFFSGMTLLGGCLVYPAGWNISIVQDVCGPLAGEYSQGNCAIRWAFVLAGIGVADSVVLSILAFVLGSYYVKMLPKNYLNSKGEWLPLLVKCLTKCRGRGRGFSPIKKNTVKLRNSKKTVNLTDDVYRKKNFNRSASVFLIPKFRQFVFNYQSRPVKKWERYLCIIIGKEFIFSHFFSISPATNGPARIVCDWQWEVVRPLIYRATKFSTQKFICFYVLLTNVPCFLCA